ncbi:MAG TPA: ABC transporter substrate-binding protein [Acidimicrobiia bacterium]|nr:ABC transporter substrate-binding protein [Acidimicrobiia bacterium]
MLVALAGSACAGEVGKYRNAQPAVGATRHNAETAAPAAAPAESAAAPVDGSAGNIGANPLSPTVPDSTSSGVSSPAWAPRGRSSHPATTRANSDDAGGSGPVARTAPKPDSGPPGPAPANAAAARPGGPGQAGSSPTAATTPAPVPSRGTTTGITKETISIGLFYPKTGAYAGIARNAPAVVQAAFDEAGPINGRRVVLKTYDDGTANPSTIQVEEKRAKDEVFALSSVVSESNVVLAPLADQHKVPLVVGNIDQKVALPLTYAFPIFPFWTRQATILPSFITNALSGADKKIGIVYEGTSTAIDAKNAFKEKAKERALNVVFEQPIAQNQSACANEVANLQSRGVQIVFMMNGPLGAICMLRDANALGYKPTWTGVGASWGFNIVATASGGGADGIRTLSSMTTLETPAGRHYSEVMRKHAPNSGADSDDGLMLAYAIAQPLLEALRRAGPDLTREGFVRTMEVEINGYESGYTPPPTFGPKIRYGPTTVGVTACCTNGRWTTPQSGWRAEF